MKGSTEAEPIPMFRRQIINDPNELPDRYSSTPNGTLYSTTPGGTRIIYERNFLMNLKNSPLAKSPPRMAYIPGVTNIQPTDANNQYKARLQNQIKNGKGFGNNMNKKKMARDEQPQFEMEI